MRHIVKLHLLSAFVVTGLLIFASCSLDEGARPGNDTNIEQRGPTNGTPVSTPLIGLTPDNELVYLMSGPPARDMGTVMIKGLRPEESIIAIDTRPRTKQIYGVSNMSVLYILDVNTGDATPVSGLTFVPEISGEPVGFDFNPTDDLIRLITSQGQNLRISPMTGQVVGVDVPINSFTAAINSLAYSYTIPGSRSTLYDIDIAEGILYKQTSPNSGVLNYVGPLGFYFSGEGGFDITDGNVAFAVQFGRSRGNQTGGGTLTGDVDDTSQDAYRLYTINLRTGQASSYGKVRPMIGLAVR